MSSATDPSPTGELVVRNGKRKGTRLPLRPVTVIGSAAGCDVRLTGDGVGLAHCVVGLTAEGPALRAGFSGHIENPAAQAASEAKGAGSGRASS